MYKIFMCVSNPGFCGRASRLAVFVILLVCVSKQIFVFHILHFSTLRLQILIKYPFSSFKVKFTLLINARRYICPWRYRIVNIAGLDAGTSTHYFK